MRPPAASVALIAGTLGLLVSGCRLTPLAGKLDPGQEPYLVLAGRSVGEAWDLFAIRPGGSQAFQLTFTRQPESAPALDPSGAMLAFLRRDLDPEPRHWLVVMNLVSGAERETHVPTALGAPDRVGWSEDGRRLYVRAERGVLFSLAPPDLLELAPVGPAEGARAESALAVLLGSPAFARAVRCPEGGVCVETAEHPLQPLGRDARDPFRWGSDSVAYLVGDQIEVRPLGGGRARRVFWSGPPEEPGAPTYFAGPVGDRPSP